MSTHDLVLIGLSTLVTVFLLDRFRVISVPIACIFNFDWSRLPGLDSLLTADEKDFVKKQTVTWPRITVYHSIYYVRFVVEYERDGQPVKEEVEDWVTLPGYPTDLWTCPLDASTGFDRPRLVARYESPLNRIVVGLVGGRFELPPFREGRLSLMGDENALIKAKLVPSVLRKLDPEFKKNNEGHPSGLGFWQFDVIHEDQKARWGIRCHDISGYVNRRRFL